VSSFWPKFGRLLAERVTEVRPYIVYYTWQLLAAQWHGFQRPGPKPRLKPYDRSSFLLTLAAALHTFWQVRTLHLSFFVGRSPFLQSWRNSMAHNQIRVSRRDFLIRSALLAGLATTGAALAACAPPAPSAAPSEEQAPAAAGVTLTMWKGPHKPAGDETKLYARPTLDMFEAEHPDIKVEFTEVPWAQYNEKFTAAFAANAGPDVSYQTESFPRFVEADHILPLDDLIASSGFDMSFFYERALGPGNFDGSNYALPWIIGGSNLFWNKDLFEQAGLDPETPPDTVEDFLSFAQQITALGDDIYGFASTPRDSHENSQWPRRFGGDWFDAELTTCTIDSEAAVAGLNFLYDLYHTHNVAMPGAISGQEPGVLGYFRDGKVGMITAQNVTANTIRQEKPDFNLGAARMAKGPADEPLGRACYGGVGMLAIAKASAHPQEAWTLVSSLLTPDLLTSWIGGLGFMSVAPSVNFYADDPVLTAAQETLEYTFFWPYKNWIFQFWDIESTGIESFILGQRSVDEAVQDMVTQINALLQGS
jgi:multiple sugar transport system substrate-binding protein